MGQKGQSKLNQFEAINEEEIRRKYSFFRYLCFGVLNKIADGLLISAGYIYYLLPFMFFTIFGWGMYVLRMRKVVKNFENEKGNDVMKKTLIILLFFQLVFYLITVMEFYFLRK